MDVNVESKVDVFGDPLYLVSNPSIRKIYYTVFRPERGYGLWSIKPQTGPVHPTLNGRFTSSQRAIQVVDKFLKGMKKHGTKTSAET